MASRLNTAERTTRIEASADELFAWHTRPGALERLTPPWEQVRVVEQRGGIEDGARVVLAVSLGPLSIRWVVVHRGVVPGREFRDEQVTGPFEHWIHTHSMEPDGADRCLLTDRIEYRLPLGAAGALADRATIRRRFERALAYRHALIRDDMEARRRWRGRPPLHVAVTGASGLIGGALVPLLTTGGHRVTRLVRRSPRPGEARWDPQRGTIDSAALANVDAVIHLAGEGIADRRWTAEHKRRVRESRVVGTGLVARTLAELGTRATLVSVSAIGYYGDRGDELLDENSAPGAGFLADVGIAWERSAEPAAAAGCRVVHPRLGIVLTPAGGALARLLPPFRVGLGGRIGGGRQWMSVVSIDDVVGMLHHAAMDEGLAGAANAVAPAPLRNVEFTRELGAILRRPAPFVVPATALRFALGQMADEALLSSARVIPARYGERDYTFRHPDAGSALAHVLGVADAR